VNNAKEAILPYPLPLEGCIRPCGVSVQHPHPQEPEEGRPRAGAGAVPEGMAQACAQMGHPQFGLAELTYGVDIWGYH
jgi:hypothetical protein